MSLDEIKVSVWENQGATWRWVAEVATWERIEATDRFNAVGTLTLDLPVNTQTTAVRKDRAVTIDFRGKRLTYLVADFGAKSDEQGRPVLAVVGADARCLLGDMLAWPDPTSEIPDRPPTKQPRARYRATGAIETILSDLIEANADRRGDPIAVASSGGRGGDGALSERFSNVADVVFEKATAASLGVRVGLVSDDDTPNLATMTVEFYEPEDKSAWIELAHRAGTLRTWEQHDAIPTATRTLVGGDGKAKERVYLQYATDEGTEAEETWGRVREVFVDARGATLDDDGVPIDSLGTGSDTVLALRQKGAEALISAMGQSAFTLEAVEAAGMRWVTHYDVGDLVLVQLLTGVERVERLGAVVLTADTSGLTVKPIPGNPDATDPLFKQAAIIRGLRQQVRALEREDVS